MPGVRQQIPLRLRGTAPPALYRWLNRYGIAECAGIACALAGSLFVRRMTGNDIAAAYGGAWGESIGYSTAIVFRDFLAGIRTARSTRQPFGVRGTLAIIVSLITEFGPAGLLDTFLTRPLAMGLGARFVGPKLGVLAGKLVADVLFYVPVIFVYERKRRWQRPRAV